MKLRDLSGWRRVGFALSILWIVVASAAYFGHLRGSPANSWWMDAWNAVFPFSDDVPLYSWQAFDCWPGQFGCGGSQTFDAAGYITFIFLPLALIWIIGYVAQWIKAGFARKNDCGT
jgi:hypothetical protein